MVFLPRKHSLSSGRNVPSTPSQGNAALRLSEVFCESWLFCLKRWPILSLCVGTFLFFVTKKHPPNIKFIPRWVNYTMCFNSLGTTIQLSIYPSIYPSNKCVFGNFWEPGTASSTRSRNKHPLPSAHLGDDIILSETYGRVKARWRPERVAWAQGGMWRISGCDTWSEVGKVTAPWVHSTDGAAPVEFSVVTCGWRTALVLT